MRFQQSKILYIFHCFNTTSSVKLFVVTVQIFVYNLSFTIVFFGKRKKNSRNLSHFQKYSHFENESAFRKRTTFWKWKHASEKVKSD